jgi:hypothetical protein
MKSTLRVGGVAALVQVFLSLCTLVVLASLERWGYSGNLYDVTNWPDGFQPVLFVSFIQICIGLTLLLFTLVLYDIMHTDAPNLMRLSVIMAALCCGSLFLSAAVVATISKINQTIPPEQQVTAIYVSWRVIYPGIRHGAFFALGLSVLCWGVAGLMTKRLPSLLCILAVIGGLGALLDMFTTGTWVMPVRAIFFVYVIAALWLGVLLLRQAARHEAAAQRLPLIQHIENPG